jgi:hypothetical protein
MFINMGFREMFSGSLFEKLHPIDIAEAAKHLTAAALLPELQYKTWLIVTSGNARG